ncbi:hypothetical protein CW707_04830 [Candidatus Bathyarchaeota archaeon]|nr:MAG: hypothetical protein CW707_04830 [Candidatus Bathyarchaeota archaeon]
MDILTIILTALGLAMDAFAVSISQGITIISEKTFNAFKMAAFFGFFQAFMPIIGWTVGHSLSELISGVDHWLAFGLLCLIGLRMIYKSSRKENAKENTQLNFYVLLALAIATSIDALAAGVSLAFLKILITTPIIIIGVTTFVLSFIGASFGNKLGKIFEDKIEAAGGIILIFIGIKTLAEHTL